MQIIGWAALGVVVIGSAACVVACLLIKKKNMQNWIGPYIRQRFSRRAHSGVGPIHVMFCFVDHFEPQWGKPDRATEDKRVDRWFRDYPIQASQYVDADGVHPQHSFFYPEEEYRAEHLAKIADICAHGYGEIEVHLHHGNDTAENFRTTLEEFVRLLHDEHGAFSVNPDTGKLAWAFIHGNWALCNSGKTARSCGVNEELSILRELGCYCDMTLPCAPAIPQTSTINSIYYASDIPGQKKSHDKGVPVTVGGKEAGDLMLVQGPLGLNLKERKRGILPAIENGDITATSSPSDVRVDMWVETGISVLGRPDWVFVKVHTHGTQEADWDTLLGDPCNRMYEYLGEKYNDGEKYVLHYTSAREMYNIIKAAEAGEEGNPNLYRNYKIPKPAYKFLKPHLG